MTQELILSFPENLISLLIDILKLKNQVFAQELSFDLEVLFLTFREVRKGKFSMKLVTLGS